MFWKIVNEFCKNYETIVWVSTIMVSAMIVAIGFLKKIFFNKVIKSDSLRDAVLSTVNIIASFGTVAVTFWIKGITFDYYWFAATAFCVYSVFVYWLYTHTKAKKGIQKLGEFVWGKIAVAIADKVNSIAENTNQIADIITSSSSASTITKAKKEKSKKSDDLSKI